jgi:intracellular septation protein A
VKSTRLQRRSPLTDALARLSQGLTLNWNTWVRQIHRWLSIAFTAAVIVNVVALEQKEQAVWVGLLALLPLALLLVTGLYLFVLPYATKCRCTGG